MRAGPTPAPQVSHQKSTEGAGAARYVRVNPRAHSARKASMRRTDGRVVRSACPSPPPPSLQRGEVPLGASVRRRQVQVRHDRVHFRSACVHHIIIINTSFSGAAARLSVCRASERASVRACALPPTTSSCNAAQCGCVCLCVECACVRACTATTNIIMQRSIVSLVRLRVCLCACVLGVDGQQDRAEQTLYARDGGGGGGGGGGGVVVVMVVVNAVESTTALTVGVLPFVWHLAST